MQLRPLRKLLSTWKQDIAGLAFVAIYVAMTFVLVLAWGYLSETADAFVSDAKRINSEALADTARFQPSPVRHARVSGGASSTCGSDMAVGCEQLKAILPQ
jgi:hypothetical protein